MLLAFDFNRAEPAVLAESQAQRRGRPREQRLGGDAGLAGEVFEGHGGVSRMAILQRTMALWRRGCNASFGVGVVRRSLSNPPLP